MPATPQKAGQASYSTGAMRILLLRDAGSIRRYAPVFRQAALRMQQCSMHGLEYALERELASGKTPVLAVALRAAADADALEANDVEGLMLVYEYRILGIPTGVFSTQDVSGLRAVVARPEVRQRFVAEACAALLGRWAHLLLVSFQSDGVHAQMLDELGRVNFGRTPKLKLRRRQAEQSLALLPTLHATLATLGKHTRANLRYYARKLQRDRECTFVADAAADMAESDLLQANAESRNPMREQDFVRATRAVREGGGGYLCGLRAHDGQWLSLIGGWRQGHTTVVEWQCNRAGMDRYSLTTAMRMHFLEHEIALGMRTLRIFGGTPHTIQNSFQKAVLCDVLLTSGRSRAMLMRCCSSLFRAADNQRQRQNFLLQFLGERESTWRTLREAPQQRMWLARGRPAIHAVASEV